MSTVSPNTLPAHVSRMLIERYELAEKAIALQKFINNADGPFNTLPDAERTDMKCQLIAMHDYQDALERRIRRADPENTHG